MALTSALFFDKCEIVQISIRQNQSVVNAFLPIMFKASGQTRCPIAFSCFPLALRRGVQLTACKGIQKIPNYQVIREIFCDNIVFQEGMHSLLRCLLCAEKGFTRENNGKTRKEIEEWHFSLKKFGDMKYY